MKIPLFALFAGSLLAAQPIVFAQNTSLVPPPQDQGLPYTHSGRDTARQVIKDCIAVFANSEYGSRYAYVKGYKVRLDDAQVLEGEAVCRDGVVYVPTAFVGILGLNEVNPAPAPEYMAKKWVYSIPHTDLKIPGTARKIEVKGRPYVAFTDVSEALGLKVWQHPCGLLLASRRDIAFDDKSKVLMDAVVTLFDTPEKLADPNIATAYVPTLKAQGKWTDHVKVTPEELKKIEGPETEWPMTPESQYDYTGLNKALFGSKVPAPGVYPRLLFSEADLPMLFKRLKESKQGQKTLTEWEVMFRKTWWNPETTDGQVFLKLSSDKDYQTLQWPKVDISPGASVSHSLLDGQKPGIFGSHVNYNTNCLTSMALYCLLTSDEARGKQVASALCNYYKLLEPFIDMSNAESDSEFGVNPDAANHAETAWRGMNGLATHMDLPFALDFAGKWMTPEQKDSMRRFIVKATYGRRDNMQAAPLRVRDINHMTWHLTSYLAAAAIEGLEGCDPEVLQAGRESAQAFCEWGIDKNGQIFESNGKNGGGLNFQILTMNTLARRGLNLWGHPHWRKLLAAQVQCTSPDGKATVSGGTYGGRSLSFQAVNIFKAFYPGDNSADYLLSQNVDSDPATFDLAAYRAKLEKSISGVRLPGPTYCGFTFSGLYDTDWKQLPRADVGLPLTFDDDVHGILSAYSDASPEATWLCMLVRSNQYIGSGHHHADVGMFYMSGLGVNWITESPFTQSYDGKYHNEVLIDGIAEPNTLPARGRYLGAAVSPVASFGSADQTRSYSYKWMNQMILWDGDDHAQGQLGANGATSWHPDPKSPWALETEDPLPLAVYKGTQHNKSRPWWPTYNFSNWMPVLRAPFNPVQYAFRSAGTIRGAYPYTLIVDDLKKDDNVHLYQWSAMTGTGVTALPSNGSPDLILVRSSDLESGTAKAGAPLLLVRVFDTEGQTEAKFETATDGAIDKKSGKPQKYDRIIAGRKGTQTHFKTVLIPFHQGEQLPATTWNADHTQLFIASAGQNDEFTFTGSADGRSRFSMQRNGTSVLDVK